jgi:hypothetical protein
MGVIIRGRHNGVEWWL